MAGCAVVLKSIAKGKYIEVAAALRSILSLQEQVAGRIVSSMPLVLFGGIKEAQARAVVQAMAPVGRAGGTLEIDPRGGGGYARMSWPEPPTIGGRDLESFASPQSSAALRCPVCGAELVLMPAGAPAEPAATVDSGAAFEEELEMLGEIDAGVRAPDVPKVPAASRVPAASEASAGPTSQTVVAMDLEDFEASFADQAEEELGRDDILQELGEAQGKPAAGAPSAQPKQAPAGAQAQPPSAWPKPTKRPGSAPKTPPRVRRRRKTGSAPAPSTGTGSYSVFASRSNNPRFLELLADVQGITPQEAKKLVKRPVVQVMRDVSQKEAEAIRDRFIAERFQARIHTKGG